MPERRYTLSELDRMRAGIRNRAPYPSCISYSCGGGGGIATLTPESRAAIAEYERQVEDQLRTALVAGIDPSEFPELKSE